jgi:hypothetical protein
MKPGTAHASTAATGRAASRPAFAERSGMPAERLFALALPIAGLVGVPFTVLARLARVAAFTDPRRAEPVRRALSRRRWHRLNVLIVGLGGEQREGEAGEGPSRGVLDLWRAWLPRAEIAAIDATDKTRLSAGRTLVYHCGPGDKGGLERIARIYGGFDVVVDTGTNAAGAWQAARTFEQLQAHLRPGGLYIVQTTQGSVSRPMPSGQRAGQPPPGARTFEAWLHALVDSAAGGDAAEAATVDETRRSPWVSVTLAPGLVIVER